MILHWDYSSIRRCVQRDRGLGNSCTILPAENVMINAPWNWCFMTYFPHKTDVWQRGIMLCNKCKLFGVSILLCCKMVLFFEMPLPYYCYYSLPSNIERYDLIFQGRNFFEKLQTKFQETCQAQTHQTHVLESLGQYPYPTNFLHCIGVNFIGQILHIFSLIQIYFVIHWFHIRNNARNVAQ